MLTKNGKNLLLGCSSGQDIKVILTSGSSQTVTNSVAMKAMTDTATENFVVNKTIMRLGSGTTKETENDYCLQNPTSWAQCKPMGHSITQTISTSNDGSIAFFGTFTNTTTSTVTVSEIGLLFSLADTSDKKFLIARKTFTPIQIAPNASKAFTVELS